MTTYAKFVDVTVCTACRGCMVSCKNWNDRPVDIQAYDGTYQSHVKPDGNTWNVLQMKELEMETGFEWVFRHSACYHCHDAACEKVCPEDAIYTTELGNVVIDQDKCVGCSYCVNNCPFDIVELADYVTEDGEVKQRAQKCDLCNSRIHAGLQPACAQSCPVGSINFGTREEMLQLAQERLEVAKEKFPNAQIYDPSGVGGLNMFYLLPDAPEKFDLPTDPKVPLSATIWKDYAQPLGKLAFGGAAMAVATAYVAGKLFDKKEQSSEEGGDTDGK